MTSIATETDLDRDIEGEVEEFLAKVQEAEIADLKAGKAIYLRYPPHVGQALAYLVALDWIERGRSSASDIVRSLILEKYRVVKRQNRKGESHQ